MTKILNVFFDGSPKRVIIKLLITSVIVGFILSTFGFELVDVVFGIQYLFNYGWKLIQHLWNMGFDAVYVLFKILIMGAVIVVPIFILKRLLKWK